MWGTQEIEENVSLLCLNQPKVVQSAVGWKLAERVYQSQLIFVHISRSIYYMLVRKSLPLALSFEVAWAGRVPVRSYFEASSNTSYQLEARSSLLGTTNSTDVGFCDTSRKKETKHSAPSFRGCIPCVIQSSLQVDKDEDSLERGLALIEM